MTRYDRAGLIAIAVTAVLGLLPPVQAQAQSPLVLDATTNKQTYYLGEPVEITVSACNTGEEPYELELPLGGCPIHDVYVLDMQGVEVARFHPTCGWCLPGAVGELVHWEPGGCNPDETIVWNQRADQDGGCDQSGPQVPPGVYRLQVQWQTDQSTRDYGTFTIQGAIPVSTQALTILVIAIIAAGCLILRSGSR